MHVDARLMIIGGGAGPDLLRRFVTLSGGPGARILVIATASMTPSLAEDSYISDFLEFGAGSVTALRIQSRDDAGDPDVEATLRAATGVFFTGGDQERIIQVIGGTTTDAVLQELVGAGSVVLGGTSAGAAMMSGTMIVEGDAHGITRHSVRTGPGLEFLPGVLIDQHFGERGRVNRLLSAVALHPHELGLGIDEDTALLTDGVSFEVLGSGAVTVVDAGAATAIRVPDEGPIALAGARIHVLPAGCVFHLAGRRPIVDAPAEPFAAGQIAAGQVAAGPFAAESFAAESFAAAGGGDRPVAEGGDRAVAGFEGDRPEPGGRPGVPVAESDGGRPVAGPSVAGTGGDRPDAGSPFFERGPVL